MDETINVQPTAETLKNPDIPENTLLNEPEYILKKKFCFAAILYLIGVLGITMSFLVEILNLFINPEFSSITTVDYSYFIKTGITVIASFVLCILLFAKVNRPVLSVPYFILASGACVPIAAYCIQCIKTCFTSDCDFIGIFFGSSEAKPFLIDNLFSVLLPLILAISVIIFTSKKARTDLTKKKKWYIPFAVYAVFSFLQIFGESAIKLVAWPFTLIIPLLIFGWIAYPYEKVLKKVPAPEVEIPAPEETSTVEEMAEETEEISTVEEETEKAEETVHETAKPEPVKPEVAPPPVRPAPMQPPVVNRPPVNVPVSANQSVTVQKNNIELIKQYKELLDMGAITQEEYDKKKNKLLDI